MNFISRREFLQRSTAGLAAFGASTKSWASQSEFCDVMIVGSGFGGAVAALRLAQAGVRSVILERGRRWPIRDDGNTFATFQNPDWRAAWLSTQTNSLDDPPIPIDKGPGVLELIAGNGIDVRNGAGVGGGSLVYNAIMLQPRRKLFEEVFPSYIDYDEMASVYYPRVRRMIGQSPIPADILASPYYASTRANLEQALGAGMFHGRQVEYAIDWNIVRQEIAGNRPPSAIDGQSWYGLNSGAKLSVDRNYLKRAEDTGRVQILTQHIVTELGESRKHRLYYVAADEIDIHGEVVRKRLFACRHLFLAAGAMGTPSLLVKARDKGTLPRLNKWVGRLWGGNGDFIAMRSLNPDTFSSGQGGPSGHVLFEDRANAFSPTNMVELVIPKPQAIPGFALYVGLGIAPPVGYFTYDPATDAVTLNWPNDSPRLATFSQGANAMLDALNQANPGSFTAFNTEDPAYKAAGGPALSAHPMGGAVIGKVCDSAGRVDGHPRLYVMDGSLIPGGSVGGVNPSFTIAALAERAMERIVSKGD